MTEQELRKKYEEGAKNYVETHKDSEVRRMYGHHFRSFLAGAEHAHSEGKKEGWNESLDAVRSAIDKYIEFGFIDMTLIEFSAELQKLRK